MSHQPTLFLGSKKLTGISAFRQKKTILGRTTKVLTSFKTTAVLGAVLGTLLFPSAALGLVKGAGRAIVPKTVRGAIKTAIIAPVAVGLIASSPKVRDILKRTLSPKAQFERGQAIGGLVEDPSKLLPDVSTGRGVGTKAKEIAKAAGLLGGVAAATVGGFILAKKGISKVKSLIPSGGVRSVVASPLAISPLASTVLPSAATIEQPIGAVQKPIEDEKIPVGMPSIKIINKPQNIVDVRINQSKRFINQQVLIKQ